MHGQYKEFPTGSIYVSGTQKLVLNKGPWAPCQHIMSCKVRFGFVC